MKIFRQFLRYWTELARELSDENAYARHLRRTGHAHSAAEWKRFIDRRLHLKYQKAKCC